MCSLIQTDGDKTYYLCIRRFNSFNFISVIKETNLTGSSLFPVMEKKISVIVFKRYRASTFTSLRSETLVYLKQI